MNSQQQAEYGALVIGGAVVNLMHVAGAEVWAVSPVMVATVTSIALLLPGIVTDLLEL